MKERQQPAVPLVGRWVARLVAWCARYATAIALLGVTAGIAAAIYSAGHMAIDTDTAKLISPDLPWRKREAAFDAAFPQRTDLIVVVVDAKTPELAERSTASLAARLAEQGRLFRSVRRPDGGAFFDREGLLFSSTEDLGDAMQRLIAAQPLLAMLAADPTLRGIMDALALMLEGAQHDPKAFDQVEQPIAVLANTFEAVQAGSMPVFSWRTMIAGGNVDPRELRRFILAQPVLDYTALEPGARATQAIRDAARALGIAGDPRVRIRLTGPVPLGDEELATLAQGAGLDAAIMVGALLALLWLALRSPRLVFAVVLSLVVGLALTTAFGLMVFGRFNLISVAFAVLFVGLGVDFGIQFCVAYRANRLAADDLPRALRSTGGEIGGSLALAAVSTAIGFYAFVPTLYRGVSELGVIAGTGMVLAFFASVTFLPALLVVFRARREKYAVGYAQLAPLDDLIQRTRRRIIGVSLIVGVISLALLPRLAFDFNPLNLRSASTESVATIIDLQNDPFTSPNSIDVLTPSLAQAVELARSLDQLPEVEHTLTLASFVPEHQQEKLALIQDAALLLDPLLHAVPQPAPDDAEIARAFARTAAALLAARDVAPDDLKTSLTRLGTALQRLAQAAPGDRERAKAVLVPGLVTMLDQVRAALGAEAVSIETLPADLVRDWVVPDGRARIEVLPKANDNRSLVRFVDAVRQLAPEATGAPVSIQESGRTIIRSFIEAGVYALVFIVLLLALTLRHTASVLLTLAPLLLAGIVTLGICALLRFPLNFENIIALPLLFGIGVAFDIYFIMAWRAGRAHLLESSLTRAVLFSALTTGSAFGSLWLSAHPGTSSMGKLLALSLACTLVSVLVFLPALLRSVRYRPSRKVP